MSVLAAGLLLATATFVLPSAKTFGSETDVANQVDQYFRQQAAGGGTTQTTQAPAPPAAPLDNNTTQAGNNAAPSASNNAPQAGDTGVGANSSGLPSTGDGGYTGANSMNFGLLLMGLGVAMLGSGSLAWAVSRKRR